MDGSVRVGRFLGFLLISTLLLSLLPVASAETISGFGYSGGLTAPGGTALSSVVAWSNDGSLLATSYHDEVVITTVESRRTLVTLDPLDVVRSLAFSDDDSYLVVGLESPYQSTLAVAVFETGGWSRITFTEEGRDVDSISFLPGGLLFAVANDADGVIEYELTTGHEQNRFEGGHSERVTCISHSPDGEQLLTGGEDGVINLWDRSGPSITKSWPADEPISGCAISPNGEWIVWTSGSLMQVRKLDDHTLVSTVHLAGDSKNLEWSPDSTGIWLLTEFAAPQLQLFSSSTWAQEHVIDIGHKATFFSVAPGQRLFAVTSSGKVTALYSMDRWQPGFGVTGIDLDQDGIPNPRDSDDDGDGIPDEFDNICPSGSHCPSYPDVDLIRSVTITANGRLLRVTDTVQLNLSQSVLLRELAAHAVNADNQVDNVEVSRIDRMLCKPTDNDQVLSAWASVISVDAAAVLSGRVTCNGKTGLVGTKTNDDQIRVEVRWDIEFTLSNSLSKPYNLSYDLGVPSPYGTIAMAVPQWPVRMLYYHEGNLEFDSGVVAKSAPAAVLYVEADPPQETTIIELTSEWLTANPGPVAGTFVILATVLLVVVRLRNRVDFQLEQEGEGSEQYDDEYGEYQYQQLESIDEYSNYVEEEFTPPVLETSRPQTTVATRGSPPARRGRQQPDRPPPDQRKTRKVVRPDADESEVEHEDIVEDGPPDPVEDEPDPAMRIAADLAAETSAVDDTDEESEDSKAIEDALSMVTSKTPPVQPELDPQPSGDEPQATPSPLAQDRINDAHAVKKRRRPVRRRKK